MKVVDITGRIVEQKENLVPSQTIRIGDKYKNGIYFAEVQQGNNKKTLRLLKL